MITTVIDFTKPNTRRCAECTLCCTLVPVKEINKPANHRCTHQSFKGCGIYRKPGFPFSCAVWSCRWLLNDDTQELRRPDRVHYVIDAMPDVVTMQPPGEAAIKLEAIQIWVDPKHRDAWRDPELLAYLDRRGKDGAVAIIRFSSSDGFVLFPPSLSPDKQWHEVGGTCKGDLTAEQRLTGLAEAYAQRGDL